MPLSSKLRADYIELINQQLDNIQIDSIEDFALAQQALQNIIQPVEGYSSPEKYREKMFLIKYYLQSPEDYVEHERNYSEYQQIIRERIAAKANELQSLNTTQKQAYIQHQQAQRSQTAANQQIMAQRHPPQPGSDAHVQTENEWLAERQRQFNREPEVGRSSQRSGPGWQRRNFSLINDMTWASTSFTATDSVLDAIRRLDEIRTRDRENSDSQLSSIAGRNAQESQQPPINAEQTQRLIESYQRYIDEYNQTHDSVQNDFFTDMGNNRNFNWFPVVGLPQRGPVSPQNMTTQTRLDMQAIRHLDTVRQEDLELQTGQRNLIENGQAFGLNESQLEAVRMYVIENGQAFGLNESQLEAVRMYVIDKLSVVSAMFKRIFSMLDFKDLTTEQISNVGTIALANPNCITALSDGRTTITQLADMDVESLRQAVESDDYPSIGLRS